MIVGVGRGPRTSLRFLFGWVLRIRIRLEEIKPEIKTNYSPWVGKKHVSNLLLRYDLTNVQSDLNKSNLDTIK